MIIQLMIFGVMLTCAILPFLLLSRLVRSGQSGLALSIASLIGATFAIFFYESGRPLGIEPFFAMSMAMLVCVPALLGCAAGALLGWLLRKRDDREI
jgi:hypothetical protein